MHRPNAKVMKREPTSSNGPLPKLNNEGLFKQPAMARTQALPREAWTPPYQEGVGDSPRPSEVYWSAFATFVPRTRPRELDYH